MVHQEVSLRAIKIVIIGILTIWAALTIAAYSYVTFYAPSYAPMAEFKENILLQHYVIIWIIYILGEV